MMKKGFLFLFGFLGFTQFIYCSGAYDFISIWDSKTNAFLGGGIANIADSGSLFINPAGLANINKLEVSYTSSMIITDAQAPANGANTVSKDSTVAPLGATGFAYRLNDRISTGFGFFTPAVGGATYKNINFGVPGLEARDMGGTVYFIEFGPSIAFSILKNLRAGLTYRINYSRQTGKLYDVSDLTNVSYNELKLSGFGFTGIRLGLQYDPIEQIHLGLTYSNRVNIKTTGQVVSTSVATNVATTLNLDSYSEYADKIIAGLVYDVIKEKLFLGFDFEYDLYSNYTDSSVTYTDLALTTSTPELKKNNVNLKFYGQYNVNEKVPVRLAFSSSLGASNKAYHNSLSTGAPGPSYVFGLGSGYKINEKWDVSGAFSFAINRGSISATEAITPYATAGDYKGDSYYLSVGFNYNI